jgi:hypothetical protein
MTELLLGLRRDDDFSSIAAVRAPVVFSELAQRSEGGLANLDGKACVATDPAKDKGELGVRFSANQVELGLLAEAFFRALRVCKQLRYLGIHYAGPERRVYDIVDPKLSRTDRWQSKVAVCGSGGLHRHRENKLDACGGDHGGVGGSHLTAKVTWFGVWREKRVASAPCENASPSSQQVFDEDLVASTALQIVFGIF